MSKDILIKKGLDINLKGVAEKVAVKNISNNVITLKAKDFHNIVPKLLLKIGEKVKAGEAVFHSKSNEDIKFPSPISGELVDIIRGAKRKILALKIEPSKNEKFVDFGIKDPKSMKSEEIKSHLLASGCWPFIKQRPYDIIANPKVAPKAIFISAYASAPLAADYDFILAGKEKELQASLIAISKLTDGEVHVSVGKNSNSP